MPAMPYTILVDPAAYTLDEVGGSAKAIAAADIVVGWNARVLKARHGVSTANRALRELAVTIVA